MNFLRKYLIILMVVGQTAVAVSVMAASAVAPSEVRRWQEDKTRFYLVDVRSGSAFNRKHIEGAINIPAFIVAKKGLPKDDTIVIYDNGIGTTEARIAENNLAAAGYSRVIMLNGGLVRWEADGLPLTAPLGVLDSKLVEAISAAELVQALRDGLTIILLDLRDSARFKSGSIPGARNVATGDLARMIASWRRDDIIVLFDGGEGEMVRQAEVLRRAGFKLVRFLYGGYPEWKRQSS